MLFGRKRELFQEDIEPRCMYCAKGAPLDDGKILCAKRGVVRPGGSCPAFRYDPFKRVPPKPVKLNTKQLSDDDFKLDG